MKSEIIYREDGVYHYLKRNIFSIFLIASLYLGIFAVSYETLIKKSVYVTDENGKLNIVIELEK